MSTLLNEIFQESEAFTERQVAGKCHCHQCSAARRNMQHQTVFTFELAFPYSEIATEIQMESITEKLLRCLRQIQNISVLPSNRANEITLELQYDILLNKAAGDRFRNRIGITLKKCLAAAGVRRAKIQVERDRKGGKIMERVKGGTRYIDIRVLNGKKILANIETKKGLSKYHDSQKQKDAQIKRKGRGQTFVVRNCPPGSTHPDCLNRRKTPRPIRNEVNILGELLNENEM